MISEPGRELLEQVLRQVVGQEAQIEWVDEGRDWSAHARLVGAGGLVSHVLTSGEIQMARFEDPPCSTVILTSTDEDEVREALAKLARAVAEYSAGGGHVVQRKGLFGTRPVLVLRTTEGEWRIGKRSSAIPY